MFDPENFKANLFLTNESNFQEKSLDLFSYQFLFNPVYKSFCEHLRKTPKNVIRLEDIPYLPIEFFKTHVVKTGEWEVKKSFQSSGTTGMSRSKHHVKDIEFYHQVAIHAFENNYGGLDNFEILALLPSYLEQGDSSLISMVDAFMNKAKSESSYYLGNELELANRLTKRVSKKLLIGVSYALLDFAENHTIDSSNLIVMETGGMKGRRKELTRAELHSELKKGFFVSEIHSEYGMSELTSQAYGANGHFQFPFWCKISLRDINDPFSQVDIGKTGGINIIDLANVHTCAFIETKDLGRITENRTFEVLGRFDNSDIRGCNLMV